MSDLKCIKCGSTETLISQTIDGEEQRICKICNLVKVEEDPSDAVVTIEVVTSPASPCFQEPLALRTNEVVDLIKMNTEANNVTETSEANEECDGDTLVVVDDFDDVVVVVDESMLSDNDVGSNNNNVGNDYIDVGLESDPAFQNEKHTNEAVVVVLSEETKEISTISKQDTKDVRILLPPPPPPPPRKDVIDVEVSISESDLNQQQKQENAEDGDKNNQENTITKEAIVSKAAAGTVENGTSMLAASITTTTTETSITTTPSTATAKVTLAPSSMTITATTTQSRTTAATRKPSSTASKIQEPKAKPVSPMKSSPTIVRRLRKSTRSTRFRSKMLASGDEGGSGAGNASGPSGLQNHHSHHYHASHNGSGGTGSVGGGNNANSAASSSGKGQNKGGRNRRTLFKRPAVKTPIMHATTRSVTSVFFKGSYLQIGDIVSLVDSENMVYYAQIRGLLVDAYCEKSAFLSWLIPTQDSPDPKEAFDPATYLIGPDEEFSRKLTYLKFVMHAPSNYYHDRTTPFPLPDAMDPVKQTGGYIWTHLPMDKCNQDTELRTYED